MSGTKWLTLRSSVVVLRFSKLSLNLTDFLLYLSVLQQLDRLSMLAFHPVKMQSCYETMDQLNLEGLQQRFDVSSPSVFVSRAQILMRGVSHQHINSTNLYNMDYSAATCWRKGKLPLSEGFIKSFWAEDERILLSFQTPVPIFCLSHHSLTVHLFLRLHEAENLKKSTNFYLS